MSGVVHGVGVGPGDPELLTARAIRIIGEADAIFFIEADGRPSRALKTVSGLIGEAAALHPIPMPMRENPEAGAEAHDRAAQAIIREAERGKVVAVLCEGDPMLYGSFIHLMARLKDSAPVAVTPGIPSFLAAAAALPVALTRRTEAMALIPGTLDEAALTAALRPVDCAAILKTGRHLPKVRRALAAAGLSRAVVVEEASGAGEKIAGLSERREPCLPYFAVILAWREGAA